jgi:hypothetical protein
MDLLYYRDEVVGVFVRFRAPSATSIYGNRGNELLS